MTREYSAGGIVYREKEENREWLVAQHSQHKGWVFPKGLIGDHVEGESAETTAVREVREETGITAKIIKKLEKSATYFYVWQGEKRLKTVYYFLMEYVSGSTKDHDFEMCDVEWIAEDDVLKRLSYKSDKESFQQILLMVG